MAEQNPRYTYAPDAADGTQEQLISDIRALIPDTAVENAKARIFSDAEILGHYRRERRSIKRAAAGALDVIAQNEVMVVKVITLMDLKTNSVTGADFLSKKAMGLRKQADEDDAIDEDGEDDGSGMEVVEFNAGYNGRWFY